MSESRKRRHSEDGAAEPARGTIHTMILRLSEQSKGSLNDSIERCADLILRDLDEHADAIIDTLVACAKSKSNSTTVYTTLVGLINAAKYDTAKDVVLRLTSELQASLEMNDFLAARAQLRFVADLGNASVLLPGEVVELLMALVQVSSEDGVPPARADAHVRLVIEVLPWVGRDYSMREAEALDRLFTAIDTFIAQRATSHTAALAVFSDAPGGNVPQQLDALEVMWHQVSGLQKRDWMETVVHRPYIYFDEILVNSHQHELPKISLPPHTDKSQYPSPTITFRIFGPDDVPEDSALPPSRSVERMIHEYTVRDTLASFSDDIGLCASELSEMIYAHRRVPLPFITAEVVLGELLQLPAPPRPIAFYHALLAELVRTTAPFGDALTLAMVHLFDRLDYMDVESASRYAEWVAHFLNYYAFKFCWDYWSDAVAVGENMPQAIFVRQVLATMVRLSYDERIRKELPEQLLPLMPGLEGPYFRYSDVDAETKKMLMIDHLLTSIKAKDSQLIHIVPLLDGINLVPDEKSGAAEGDEYSESAEDKLTSLRLECYVLCVLQVGSRHLSHLRTILERQRPVFEYLVQTAEGRAQVVQLIAEFWAKSPLMLQCALAQLLRYGVLDAPAIIDWVFSSKIVDLWPWSYIWNILIDTLDRCVRTAEGDDVDAQKACKDAWLMVLQHFADTLAERTGAEHAAWSRTACGRFVQIGRRYFGHPLFRSVVGVAEDAVLPDLPPQLKELWPVLIQTL